MANLGLPQTQLPFAARPFRMLENGKPPVLFKAGGFFCCELDVEKKLPPALQALSDYFIQQINTDNKRLPIIIATDGTDTSQKQFERVRDHFIAQGIDVYSPFSKIDKEFPMTLGILSYYTKNFAQLKEPEKQCAAGLLITVGQNPWGTVGIRIIKPNGAMADSEMIKQLNDLVEHPKYLQTNDFKPSKNHPYHFSNKYSNEFFKIINPKIIGRYYQHIFHNALSGSTGYFFDQLLHPAIKQIYSICDGFYDKTDHKKIRIGPFVERQNIDDLKSGMDRLTSAKKVGFINDSEGISTSIITDELNNITPSDLILLLLNHFVVNKQRVGKIIKTHDTSSGIDELALKFGLPVTEVPSSFHHITTILDNSPHSILLAADGTGKLTGLNHSPLPDALFTNIAILEASGIEKVSIESQLRQIKNKLLYVYTTTQHEIKGDFNLQQSIFKNIKTLATYGGRVGMRKINLKRTLRHNSEMKKYFNYYNEYKIFFDDGSWIVAKLSSKGQVKLTFETNVFKKRLNWLNQKLALNEHNYFITQFKEKVSINTFKTIEFQ